VANRLDWLRRPPAFSITFWIGRSGMDTGSGRLDAVIYARGLLLPIRRRV
jgi:hypothetical protein